MPLYGSAGPNLLHENQQEYLLQNEEVVAGDASVPVQLRRVKGLTYPFGFSVQVAFDDDPGTFQVDVQDADLDEDDMYVTVSSLSGNLNDSFVGRVELPIVWTKYTRVRVVTLTNPVAITALISR